MPTYTNRVLFQSFRPLSNTTKQVIEVLLVLFVEELATVLAQNLPLSIAVMFYDVRGLQENLGRMIRHGTRLIGTSHLADIGVHVLPPFLKFFVAARIVYHCIDCLLDDVQALAVCETLENHSDIFNTLRDCGILPVYQ